MKEVVDALREVRGGADYVWMSNTASTSRRIHGCYSAVVGITGGRSIVVISNCLYTQLVRVPTD
jgi:hypothetical protein